MKRTILFAVILAIVASGVAVASGELAPRDDNGVPALIAEDESTDLYIRALKATPDGNLKVAFATGSVVTGVTTVGEIASGVIKIEDMDGDIAAISAAGALSVAGAVTVTGSVTVSATDLDIRNLTAASDTVTVTGDIGTVTTLTGITNDVSIDDGGNTITVDGTVSLSTTTVQITDGTDLALVDSSGNLHVTGVATIARLNTVEFKNDVIGVGAASGADLDPAAESYKFTVVNNATVDVWCKVGATPASGDGIPIKANGGSWTQENISVGDFECFNPDGAITAAVAVVFWR